METNASDATSLNRDDRSPSCVSRRAPVKGSPLQRAYPREPRPRCFQTRYFGITKYALNKNTRISMVGPIRLVDYFFIAPGNTNRTRWDEEMQRERSNHNYSCENMLDRISENFFSCSRKGEKDIP
ncbi:hypothetical protein PUN28_008451 [Cardiocondyla obscurior]|uniref:Uncharacterized protein n=1 Tax=Cardiocondyla obscurior TaxID=286306 RepID=A0AAW2G0L2_9HYME